LNKPEELQQRFSKLKDLIKARQAFEAKNDSAPYSTFKTTLNYRDVHGKDLLYYAIVLGDQEAVASLVEQGVQNTAALPEALKQGQLSIAQWLHAKKAPASSVALRDVTNTECRAWFVGFIKVEISAEITYLQTLGSDAHRGDYQTFEIAKGWAESDKADLNQRIAELGEVQLLQELKQAGLNNLNKYSYSLMIPSAASNNCVAMMASLVSLGAKINPEHPFENSPLIQAISTDSRDAIDYLLVNSVDINYQGEDKLTPLAWAVIKGNEALVARLVQSGADITLKDTNGRSVFHYVVRDGKLAILKLLLQDPRAKQVSVEQDIFGLSPKDYVAQVNKTEILRLLGYDSDAVDNKPKPRVIPNQSRVNSKMSYYLRSQYRDSKYFSNEGNCNGFNFLEEMYDDEGRLDYYDDTLELMAGWDGEQESLVKPFPTGLPQKQWYQNLLELFEQWISNVIWFQHSKLEDIYRGGGSRPDQGNRSFQFQVAGGQRKPIIISHTGSNDVDLERLTELLGLFSQRMVTGARLELVGSEHAASSAIDEDRKFTYSDPNFTRRTRKFNNQAELSQVVIDTKIIALKKLCNDATFECRARFFYFERPSTTQRLAEHKTFLDQEIPKSFQEAQDYQARSPNGYSHLQVAILTGSVLSIKQVLASGYYDLNATNINRQTALNMALNSHNSVIVDLIMSLYNATNPAPYTAFQDFFESGAQFKAKMACRHFDKIDNLLPLIHSRITMKDEFVRNFFELKSVNINSYFQGESPLIVALKSQNLAMITLVLDHGASLFYTDPTERLDCNTPLDYLVSCDISVLKVVVDTRFPDINKADDKGNSLIHYLLRTKKETSCYLLDEIISRKGDFRKMSGTGKTLFDLLKHTNNDVKEQLYSKLLPLLDCNDTKDAVIVKDLYADAIERGNEQCVALIKKHFLEMFSTDCPSNINILKN
jgi:ankyrin repeat protein